MKIKNFYFDPDSEVDDAYSASASFTAKMFLPVTNATYNVTNVTDDEDYPEDNNQDVLGK